MCMGSKADKQREQDYRAEDDFRTLQRAEEVRGDRGRHDRAIAHGRKQVAVITRVMGRTKSTRGAKPGRQVRRAPGR